MIEYTNAVETEQLTKRFGNFTAVSNINFYIPKGEVFGLLGPNGAGKTTTIRMLCGIMHPSAGKATVLGFDIVEESEQIKRNIGYMSQKFSLYNDLTALENIHFYAALYGVPNEKRKTRIMELIELSGLKGHEHELTRNLSGAWRQRLALACAIAHNPPILFLDEATAGVDPISRREFWDLIYKLAGEGVSILATTHYMYESEYCNTIGMMHRGKLIAVASPDTMKEETLHGVLLQVDCEDPERAKTYLDVLDNTTEVTIHGNMVHVIVKDLRQVRVIKKILTKEGIAVYSIDQIQPSLEDIFISMVEHERRQINQQLISPVEQGV